MYSTVKMIIKYCDIVWHVACEQIQVCCVICDKYRCDIVICDTMLRQYTRFYWNTYVFIEYDNISCWISHVACRMLRWCKRPFRAGLRMVWRPYRQIVVEIKWQVLVAGSLIHSCSLLMGGWRLSRFFDSDSRHAPLDP